MRVRLTPKWETQLPAGFDPCLPAELLRVFQLATQGVILTKTTKLGAATDRPAIVPGWSSIPDSAASFASRQILTGSLLPSIERLWILTLVVVVTVPSGSVCPELVRTIPVTVVELSATVVFVSSILPMSAS